MSLFESRHHDSGLERLRYTVEDEGTASGRNTNPKIRRGSSRQSPISEWRDADFQRRPSIDPDLRLPPSSEIHTPESLFTEFVARAGTVTTPSLIERQVFTVLAEGIKEVVRNFNERHDTSRIFSNPEISQRDLHISIQEPVLIRGADGSRKLYLSTTALLKSPDSEQADLFTAVIGGGMCYPVRGKSEVVWEIDIPDDVREIAGYETLTTAKVENLPMRIRVLYDQVAFANATRDLRGQLDSGKIYPFRPLEDQRYLARLLVQKVWELQGGQRPFSPITAEALAATVERAQFVSDYVVRVTSKGNDCFMLFRRNDSDFTVDCIPLPTLN
ncbi:MAG: hypothetical protein KDD64_08455 [Bdellovibrionales bacterium]|nr:hypothetical protein [Bdellovibrionales bacterium]